MPQTKAIRIAPLVVVMLLNCLKARDFEKKNILVTMNGKEYVLIHLKGMSELGGYRPKQTKKKTTGAGKRSSKNKHLKTYYRHFGFSLFGVPPTMGSGGCDRCGGRSLRKNSIGGIGLPSRRGYYPIPPWYPLTNPAPFGPCGLPVCGAPWTGQLGPVPGGGFGAGTGGLAPCGPPEFVVPCG